MPIAAAVIGSAVVGAIGAHSAAQSQEAGQNKAANTQQGMFNTIVGQEQPYMQGGYAAENELMYGLGIGPDPNAQGVQGSQGGGGYPNAGGTPLNSLVNSGGQYINSGGFGGPGGGGRGGIFGQGGLTVDSSGATVPGVQPGHPTQPGQSGQPSAPGANGIGFGSLIKPFSPTQEQLNNYPGYQFALQQGGAAVRNADTPGSGALSGAALKDLTNFNVGTANQYYGQYFNQYQEQQNNIFNRLSGIAGLGQNAASNTGNAGSQLGTGIAQAQAAAGGSQAGGIVGETNSLGGALTTAALLKYGGASGAGVAGGIGIGAGG